MQARNLRTAITIGGAFFLFSVLPFGCGNPEPPDISKTRLSFWDALTGEGSWVPIENGGVATQSPVRIQGNITDNTAVVNPQIVWIGDRGDVNQEGFTECSHGPDSLYECGMSCEETQEGFFECNPLLPARKLIRGDQFRLVLTTSGGEEHELEVMVSEARDLVVPVSESVPIESSEDYRILKVVSVTEEPNPFLWSLLQRKDVGGPWLPLHSGDSLALKSGEDAFQLAVETPEGVVLDGPPQATWHSLVKWNNHSFLNWDAKSGDFVQEFQVFDPREPQEMVGDEGAPTYHFQVSAQDVPDQKTGVFRTAEISRELLFAPVTATQVPDLEVEGQDEDRVETSEPAQNVTGRVRSFSGEVRSLLFSLSEEPDGTGSRSLYFDPELITLAGGFVATMVYVSDWDGDGVVDEPEEEGGGIPNYLAVVAEDVQGNWTRTTVPIFFLPSTGTNKVPELQIREIFPVVDDDGEAQLPFGEEVRVRARAADDRGQPAFSAYQCTCEAEAPPINADRCPCEPLRDPVTGGEWVDVDLNAGGEFPRDPWQWIGIDPSSPTSKTIGVLLAKEKVDDPRDLPTAQFTGVEIKLEPDSEAGAYNVSVSAPDSRGPNVFLPYLKNGDIIDPDSLTVEATIYASVSELNEITALYNGEPRGEPTFDSDTGAFLWDLRDEPVKEGDRICVGATSVTGHTTLDLLEFANTAEGLLLGVTVTSDTQECKPVS